MFNTRLYNEVWLWCCYGYLVQPQGGFAVVMVTGTDPLLTSGGVALDESPPCSTNTCYITAVSQSAVRVYLVPHINTGRGRGLWWQPMETLLAAALTTEL